MMSKNTASSPPPVGTSDAWSESEHTIEARVSPELLALTRQRRQAKQASEAADLFESSKTLEHRIPDDLMEMVRGRRQAREPLAREPAGQSQPHQQVSESRPASERSQPAAGGESVASSEPVSRTPLEWNGPTEEPERMEISQVRVRRRTQPQPMAAPDAVDDDASGLSPALVFAVAAWAGLLAYCAFLGAGF